MPFWLAVARLTGVLAGVGLATSRIGLVVHELVGHGVTAIACGGRIRDAGLYWFGGGWIRYELDEPSLAVQVAVTAGGITIELVAGSLLWVALANRAALPARLARAVGAALVIHGAWYLATGTWHGYGDGALLRRVLGDARPLVAIAAGALTIGFAFVGARAIFGPLVATLPGTQRTRISGLAIAVVLAGGLQIGLAIGEVRLRHDATYGAIMTSERDRQIARELAEWLRQQRARGVQLDDRARDLRARELADRNREFPFAIVLGVLAIGAIAAGAARSRSAADAPASPRLVAIACAAGVGSVALVIALDCAFV